MGRIEDVDVTALADRIFKARRAGQLLPPLTDEVNLDLETAYAIQFALLSRRIDDGERQVGWKIGYTSVAMREQMGIDKPNFGPLTDKMLARSGDDLPVGVVHPKVEPEVLVVIGAEITPGMDLDAIRAACREVRTALEVVDPVWEAYRFRVEDNTADGSSAAHAVLGPSIPSDAPLDSLPVAICVDGEELHRATTAAVMGHPLEAVRWLSGALHERRRQLQVGDLVLTGGLTPAVDLPSGSTVTARFASDLEVAVHRA